MSLYFYLSPVWLFIFCSYFDLAKQNCSFVVNAFFRFFVFLVVMDTL